MLACSDDHSFTSAAGDFNPSIIILNLGISPGWEVKGNENHDYDGSMSKSIMPGMKWVYVRRWTQYQSDLIYRGVKYIHDPNTGIHSDIGFC